MPRRRRTYIRDTRGRFTRPQRRPVRRSPLRVRLPQFVMAKLPAWRTQGLRPRDPQRGFFVTPRRRATIDVEDNAAEFVAGLQMFRDLVGSDMDKLVMAHALDFQNRVQMRSPVRTGRFRNSIHTVPPNTRDSFRYRDDEGREFDGTMKVRTGPGEAVVGTNVEYAADLEAGRSKQAPYGMFTVSLIEKTHEINQEIERIVRERWNSF